MKLVLQRAAGDCGIAALATAIEQSYEDVYFEAAHIERKRRGRLGICVRDIVRVAARLGVTLCVHNRKPAPSDDDEGLLVVDWLPGSKRALANPFMAHFVAVIYGLVIDPADGVVLPLDEYLEREQATVHTFLEIQ